MSGLSPIPVCSQVPTHTQRARGRLTPALGLCPPARLLSRSWFALRWLPSLRVPLPNSPRRAAPGLAVPRALPRPTRGSPSPATSSTWRGMAAGWPRDAVGRRGTLSVAGEQTAVPRLPTIAQRVCQCCPQPPGLPRLCCPRRRSDAGEGHQGAQPFLERCLFSTGRIVLSEQEKSVWLPRQVRSSNSSPVFPKVRTQPLLCQRRQRGCAAAASGGVFYAGTRRGAAAQSAAGLQSCPRRLLRPENQTRMSEERAVVEKSRFGVGFFVPALSPSHRPRVLLLPQETASI